MIPPPIEGFGRRGTGGGAASAANGRWVVGRARGGGAARRCMWEELRREGPSRGQKKEVCPTQSGTQSRAPHALGQSFWIVYENMYNSLVIQASTFWHFFRYVLVKK
jgi:hypothetical protein